MPVKVAINGFGRIGRLVLRAMVESGRDDIVPVAINDLGSTEANAHLFHYDSVHGRFPGQLEVSGDTITIRYGGRVWGPIKVSAERDPTKVPYQGVDVALECTGIFTSKEKASALLTAGARKVLISAPGDHVDATIVYGVNHKSITKDMTVVSNASCTTNCLAPMAKVLHDASASSAATWSRSTPIPATRTPSIRCTRTCIARVPRRCRRFRPRPARRARSAW